MILIHYPTDTTLPTPWQPAWEVTPVWSIDTLPRRSVARAPSGTPIPEGATIYAEPEVTDDHRRAFRDVLQSVASESADSLRRELAQGALDDPERFDEDLRACLGVAHPHALVAPLSVATLREACHAHRMASDAWTSPHSSVVVRCALRGYDVWTGIGGMMARVGRADDYPEAEALGVEAVRQRRRETLRRVREEVLAGWSPETPYYTSTIARAESELPIVVRRGPITAEELGAEGAINHSYGLPVVAVYRGGEVQRFDDRITWSDGMSRELARERQREGQRRREAEEARAVELLRGHDTLAPHLTDRGFRGGTELQLGNGMAVTLVGPVRMREDGRFPLALVRDHGSGRRIWMAVGRFV